MAQGATNDREAERARTCSGCCCASASVATSDEAELERFASLCREVYDETGANDREIAEATSVEGFDGYSRARIQQFRCGDPRKKALA
jgi:hypothetical protein